MAKVNQPNSQIKLTNVSLVRLKKGKKRFEIACYQNKVQDWRSGVEKDVDEVLQIHQVFLNVSKGEVAPADLLQKSFGTSDVDQVVLQILKKGDLQMSGKERSQQMEKTHNEILTLISTKCVNPKSKKRYPPTMIDKALKELKFNMTNTRNPKTKSLEAIRLLVEKQIIPIARAQMRLRISLSNKVLAKQGDVLKKKYVATVVAENKIESETEIVCLIEPEHYKELAVEIKTLKGTTEVLDMAVVNDETRI